MNPEPDLNKIRTKQKAIMASIFALSIILSIIWGNTNLWKPVATEQNTAAAITSEGIPEAPKNYYYTKNTGEPVYASAKAFLVGDLNTGEIILSKNRDTVFPIASVSKLMTALVQKETTTPEDLIQITKKAITTEGRNGNFIVNEKVSANDILYPLLLESSNDAAEAIALSLDRDSFISKMNRKAKELGLLNTSFEDPSGLSPNNKSTTLDLFLLAKNIKERSPELFALTQNKIYKNSKHTWFSNNQFLRKDGYLGGKSGYIDEAKQTVVSLFSIPLGKDGTREVAITLLQSNDRAKDVENILKYIKKNIYYGTEADAEAGWVKDREGVAEVKEPDFVTMTFVGDLMLDRGVRNSVIKNFAGDYSALFENLEPISTSDITFANLEGTASDKGEDLGNLYSFRMDPSTIPAIKASGIDILSLANNHVGDWGRDAYIDTLDRLRENEIYYTGGGHSIEEAERPVIIEKYGVKVGFLGFSDHGPNWMAAGTEIAGPLLANNPRFDEIIKNAASQVDHLVVSFHFGDEYQTTHNPRQESLAHRAIDSGAKLIIGHHPHVIQDTEIYKNGYIAYSLGNFIFDQAFSSETLKGMVLNVVLKKNGELTVEKNTVQLNNVFQPGKIILSKEEKIIFQ